VGLVLVLVLMLLLVLETLSVKVSPTGSSPNARSDKELVLWAHRGKSLLAHHDVLAQSLMFIRARAGARARK